MFVQETINHSTKNFTLFIMLCSNGKLNAVLDGEIIVINDKGISDFGGLQQWRSEADGELIFYLFDILWLDGYNLMQLSLD